jgi:uncharacterized protein YaaN involved in tellurite resistance
VAFNLEVIDSEELKRAIETDIKPADADAEEIRKAARQSAEGIMSLSPENTEEKRGALKAVDEFAAETLAISARKNSLLQTTLGSLSKSGEDGGAVSNSLADLHKEIKDLDPSFLDFTKEGFLVKFFNPVRRYFEKYNKADGVINDIIVSLDKGKSALKNDNTTLDLEEEGLRELTGKLNRELALGIALDEEISKQIERAEANGEDGEKVKFITEEILFPLRQRVMDMQQMLVVNHQGIVALEVVKRNNKELIRGVDRAKTVTITALRTAVMVASALYKQRIVFRKIEMLNETTGNLISSTSKMLKEQGAAIQKQAAESSISPEALKQAFHDAIAALDDIASFKQQALPKMRETIERFSELARTGEREIARLENTDF